MRCCSQREAPAETAIAGSDRCLLTDNNNYSLQFTLTFTLAC